MRAWRGAGPRRLRREKRALNRSDIGCVGSIKRSQRNFSVSGETENEESEDAILVASASALRTRRERERES